MPAVNGRRPDPLVLPVVEPEAPGGDGMTGSVLAEESQLRLLAKNLH